MEPAFIKFLIFLTKAAVLFCVFIYISIGTYNLFSRLVNDKRFNPIILGISLIVGPLLFSWLLGLMFQFMPHWPRELYLYGSLLPFLPFVLFGFINLNRDAFGFVKGWFSLSRASRFHVVVGAVIILLLVISLGGMLTANTFTPLYGNDALEYSRLAAYIATERSTLNYPLINNELTNGFIVGSSHPLGYVNLLAYGYLLQGNIESSGITRFIAPYFAFALTILLIGFAGYGRKLPGILTAFFLLTTPMFYSLIVQCHIDPTRIAAFTAAIASIWVLSQTPKFRTAIMAGLACGCSMFVHSIGILTLPIAIPIYVILVKGGRFFGHLSNIATVFGLSIMMLTMRYAINIKIFGSIVGDQTEVWTYPELGVDEARLVARYMESPLDRIVNGALMGFINTSYFGSFYIIMTGALALWVFKSRNSWKSPFKSLKKQVWRHSNDPVYAALLVVLGYMGIMFLTLMMGTDLAVKNPRYILTLQPFVIMVAARVICEYLLKDADLKTRPIENEVRT